MKDTLLRIIRHHTSKKTEWKTKKSQKYIKNMSKIQLDNMTVTIINDIHLQRRI